MDRAETEAEKWLPVPRFEGRYEVSDFGRVRRSCCGRGTKSGRILKPFFTGRKKTGQYLAVSLGDGKQAHMVAVHILVAAAFLGPRPDGYHTNHRDADKSNNRVDNLEYLTPSDHGNRTAQQGILREGVRRWNRLHPERRAKGDRHGTRTHPEYYPRGERVNTAKLTADQVVEIRRLHLGGAVQTELASRFGVSQSNLSAIILRRTWKHI